jgi:chemotaxis protein MotB
MEPIDPRELNSINSDDSIIKNIRHPLKSPFTSIEVIQKKIMKPDFGDQTPYSFGGICSDDILFSNNMPKAVPWSIAWADLMMTMFIFFAVLFIYNVSTQKKLEHSENLRTEEVEKVKNVPQDSLNPGLQGDKGIKEIYDLSKQTLNSLTSVELVPDKAVRIILKSDLLFDLGKADIKENARASLEEVAKILSQTSYMVNVVGHTDNLPISTEEFPSNWELSTARAGKIARFLMTEMKLPEDNFYISGYASYQPVKPNDNDTNRAANRRVEIIITKDKPYGLVQKME